MSVQAPAALTSGVPTGIITLTDSEIATFADSIKFAACVPKQLLARRDRARNFEAIGAQDPGLTAAKGCPPRMRIDARHFLNNKGTGCWQKGKVYQRPWAVRQKPFACLPLCLPLRTHEAKRVSLFRS